jgi:hypothetical protein
MTFAGVTKSSRQPDEKTWKWVPVFCCGSSGLDMNLIEDIDPGAIGGFLDGRDGAWTLLEFAA